MTLGTNVSKALYYYLKKLKDYRVKVDNYLEDHNEDYQIGIENQIRTEKAKLGNEYKSLIEESLANKGVTIYSGVLELWIHDPNWTKTETTDPIAVSVSSNRITIEWEDY